MKDFLEVTKSFCEGCAAGAATAVLVKKYDNLIKTLPLCVRIPVDSLVTVGSYFLGIKFIDLLESK